MVGAAAPRQPRYGVHQEPRRYDHKQYQRQRSTRHQDDESQQSHRGKAPIGYSGPDDSPVPDLSKYECPESEDDYRHRMVINAVALVFVSPLSLAGYDLQLPTALPSLPKTDFTSEPAAPPPAITSAFFLVAGPPPCRRLPHGVGLSDHPWPPLGDCRCVRKRDEAGRRPSGRTGRWWTAVCARATCR